MAEEFAPGPQSLPTKWQGRSAVAVPGVTQDQAWPYIADFCSLDKWMPTIDVCHLVEGLPGEPGLTRYCASFVNSPNGTKNTKWANERLLAIDSVEKSLSYEVTENNVGFKSYVATLRVVPSESGCRIMWEFICDPAEGWKEEDLQSYVDSSLRQLGKKIEEEATRVV